MDEDRCYISKHDLRQYVFEVITRFDDMGLTPLEVWDEVSELFERIRHDKKWRVLKDSEVK